MLALMMLVASAASVQAAKSLSWKFKSGEKLSYTVKTDSVVEGGFGKIVVNNEMDLTITPGEVAKDGSTKATVVVDRIVMKVDGGEMFSVDYDSKSGKGADNPAVTVSAAVVGKEIQVTIAADGKTSDLTPSKDVEDAWKAAEGQMSFGFGGGLSKQGIESLLNQVLLPVTGKEPKKGTSWENKVETEIGMGQGKQTSTSKYTHEGVNVKKGTEVEMIKVDVQAEMKFKEDAMFKMEIKKQDNKGTALFDATKGRLVHFEAKTEMESVGSFGDNKFESKTSGSATVELK